MGLGLPVAGQRQSAPAPAPGAAPCSDAGQQLEGPGPALPTLSPAHGQRRQCPAGRCGHGPGIERLQVGHGQAGRQATAGLLRPAGHRQGSLWFPRLSEETPPRCGVTIGSVTRPQGTLVPSMRPAPDGCHAGGSQATDISVINRRLLTVTADTARLSGAHQAAARQRLAVPQAAPEKLRPCRDRRQRVGLLG
jgi:hypothetical protein